MKLDSLASVAQAMVTPGKGLLAADESFSTIEKRFKPLGIESTEENRRAYRETLFTTPGLGDFISGVIQFDETFHQKTKQGQSFQAVLESQGIIPGIKVDKSTLALANSPGEKITAGLDGLRDRLKTYRAGGARFTKWRAVITIKEHIPTATCIEANAVMLAMYAALSQEADLVPIVEPEVLMDGSHTIDRCEDVSNQTLHTVFDQLHHHHVKLEEMILKPAMILPGKECPQQVSDDEIAHRTLTCFRQHVPAAVPGIVFLSGGQKSDEATRRLAAINRLSTGPWALTFSFGRALQDPPIQAWKGKSENVAAAQKALLECARANGAAAKAKK